MLNWFRKEWKKPDDENTLKGGLALGVMIIGIWILMGLLTFYMLNNPIRDTSQEAVEELSK
jgi:hypothetical protein